MISKQTIAATYVMSSLQFNFVK